MRFVKFPLLLLLLITSLSIAYVNSATAQDNKFIEIIAEGTGSTKIEALNMAWSEAVKQGIGMFLVAKTQVMDETVTEQIIAHAKGRVNSYKELEAVKEDGLWKVKIQAFIERELLEDAVTTSDILSVSVDNPSLAEEGRNWAAREAAKEEAKKTAEQLVEHYFDNNDLTNIYKIDKITPSFQKDNGTINLEVVISVDEKKMNLVINNFVEIIEQISIKMSQELYPTEAKNRNIQFEKNGEVDGIAYNAYLRDSSIILPISPTMYKQYLLDKKLFDLIENKLTKLNNVTIIIEAVDKNQNILDTTAHKDKFYSSIYYDHDIFINKSCIIYQTRTTTITQKKYIANLPLTNVKGLDIENISSFRGKINVTPCIPLDRGLAVTIGCS
ncbi:MAG: hypothetical protein LBJ61_03195 [Deltaproteobacteria bacterium]|jgi:hypothetical protein|nr:hypothetical protein [Deltaproteobacteria bacterium]